MKKKGRREKPRKQKSAKKIIGFLKREEKEVEEKFHAFMDVWRQHIHEEIAIHKAMFAGKHSLKQHLKDTKRIHESFLKKLKKL